jgi:hypothetical protein
VLVPVGANNIISMSMGCVRREYEERGTVIIIFPARFSNFVFIFNRSVIWAFGSEL